ncbi:MAG: hypothetical protein RR550_01575, partial [Rikenellaceae bacterium]
LIRLTSSVQTLIDNGAKSISLSTGVLDILQEHNVRVLKYYRDKSQGMGTFSEHDMQIMDSLYLQAKTSYPKSKELEAIAVAKKEYLDALGEKIDTTSEAIMSEWYVSKYNVAYTHFTNSVKEFMISSQQYVVKQTGKLKANIYRTTMQSVVALSVSILILFVFFLLIDVYFIKPIAVMTKSLERFLINGSAFHVTVDGANEPAKLKSLVVQLIQKLKEKEQDN